MRLIGARGAALGAAAALPLGRLPDLDRAKGLAIVLVVFGHLVARQGPQGVDWYETLRGAVYLFHMPFFFYLSGFVAARSGAASTPPAAWTVLARARARRLLVPFAAFGLLILLAKLALARVLVVDNVPASFGDGLVALVWRSSASPATSVWYLAALFAFSLALPLLVWADAGRLRLAVALSALLFALVPPPVLYLDRITGYFVFFVAGVAAADAGAAWLLWLDRWRAALLGGFAVLLAAAMMAGAGGAADRPWLLACGLASMPALHALVRGAPFDRSAVLAGLGRYCFSIYLLNTICIGLAKGALLRLLPWDGANFTLFALVLMASGLAGPVLIKRHVLARLKLLDQMTA